MGKGNAGRNDDIGAKEKIAAIKEATVKEELLDIFLDV